MTPAERAEIAAIRRRLEEWVEVVAGWSGILEDMERYLKRNNPTHPLLRKVKEALSKSQNSRRNAFSSS